jgi:predicted ribosome quality control (RQC) complex YloA/Tae2 family protein
MPIILSRLRAVERAVSLLRAMLDDIEQAANMDSLLAIQAGFPDRNQGKQGSGAKQRIAAEEPPGIRKIAYRGWEILVGRSAAGNDLLTTKFARPDDLWLHAEGLPGSHVLVRNPARTEVPPDILLKAAALAARYSKGRAAGKVSVTYTHARFVRKPRGAKPGLVTLSQRRTMMVKPDDGSLT